MFVSSDYTVRFGAVVGTLAVLWSTPSAIADITNTVTATGTPLRGQLTSGQDTALVPVEQRAGRLVVRQEPGGVTAEHGMEPTIVDGGDYVWFRLIMENVGDAPLSGVTPDLGMPIFDTMPGSGEPPRVVLDTDSSTAPSSDLVRPGERLVYIVSYYFTDADALRAARDQDGFDYNAGALANENPDCDCDGTANYVVPANPQMVVSTRVTLGERSGNIGDGRAAIGDLIRYTFTVENVGNVGIRDVVLHDIHEENDPHRIELISTEHMPNEVIVRDGPLAREAASVDRVQDGSWDLLQPGAVISFSYTREVSEAEFYAQ